MLLQLDFGSDVPIYLQIRNQIVMGIANGSLVPGTKLPTIRVLADQSGINMMTVSKAYQLLKSEGYIQTDRRSGAIVSGALEQVHKLDEKAKSELRLIAAQAKLAGITANEFLRLCEQAYKEPEEREEEQS